MKKTKESIEYAKKSTLRTFLNDLNEKFKDFSNELLTSNLFKNFNEEQVKKARNILNWMVSWLEKDMIYLENQKFEYLDWMEEDEYLENHEFEWKKICDSTNEDIEIFEETIACYDKDWIISEYVFYLWEIWLLFVWLQTMISLERKFTKEEEKILNNINSFFEEFCDYVIVSKYFIHKFDKESFTFNQFISYLLNESEFWLWYVRGWSSNTMRWFLRELSKKDLKEYDEESENFEWKWITMCLCN